MEEKCPKCGSPLGEITETPTGRKLQRCSAGSWNKETHKNEGCEYVKWLAVEPQELDKEEDLKIPLKATLNRSATISIPVITAA